jgi:hypothetical protein
MATHQEIFNPTYVSSDELYTFKSSLFYTPFFYLSYSNYGRAV